MFGQIDDYPGIPSDYTAWDRFDGTVTVQRDCTACDKGLLYAPARFCGACRGTGYRTWIEEDRRAGMQK